MNKSNQHDPMRSYLILTLGCLLLGTGCLATGEDADVASVSEALELENGGLDMEDDAPMFGEEALFDAADIAEEARAVVDAMTEDADVRRMMDAPDAVRYRVAIQWGQFPGDLDNDIGRDWSGIFAINRGAMVVNRTVAFDEHDRLLPRTDRTRLAFVSRTLPHRDGLILDIVDPDPDGEPLVLSYVADLPGPLGAEGGLHQVALRELLDGRVTAVVDAADNRMSVVAHARPVDFCSHGFLLGRWQRLTAPGETKRGRFRGRVLDADGTPAGHIRGIYGERRDGSEVFFGKYINRDGHFRGILAGTYGDEQFQGRWLTRAGEHGTLRGQGRSIRPGAGHFLGRWRENSCDAL